MTVLVFAMDLELTIIRLNQHRSGVPMICPLILASSYLRTMKIDKLVVANSVYFGDNFKYCEKEAVPSFSEYGYLKTKIVLIASLKKQS